MKTYVFIDSQNLNLGTSKDIFHERTLIYKGWKLDFKKFRRYLTDKFRVDKAFLCIGYIKQNEKLYEQLKSYGFNLIFKPTVKDSLGKLKGNVDAELVLHAAAIEFPQYDRAVVVSGDGDFYCLYEFLEKNKPCHDLCDNLKNKRMMDEYRLHTLPRHLFDRLSSLPCPVQHFLWKTCKYREVSKNYHKQGGL